MISWKCKKQQVVSRSFAVSEYRAMATITSEVVWLISLLKTFSFDHKQPAFLYCDSKAALYIAANPIYHERTKHIEIDCHFICEKNSRWGNKNISCSYKASNNRFLHQTPWAKTVLPPLVQDEINQYIQFILRGSIRTCEGSSNKGGRREEQARRNT